MKKFAILTVIAACATAAHAGGLLHNTNVHIAFDRMFARGATFDIDAIFSNPAGTAFFDHEGWQISVNNQSAFQKRDIKATFEFFPEGTREYNGKASVPVIPSIFVAHKHNRWTFSGMFAIIGGGGKCSFETGLPMFDAGVMAGIYAQTAAMCASNPAVAAVLGGPVTPASYTINSSMKGTQLIYGGQLGAAFRINDRFSAFAGARVNYFSGNYVGHVIADANSELASKLALLSQPAQLAAIKLDCNQTGWGVTPIIGVDFHWNRLTLGAKYEFKTNLNIENDTKEFEVAPADYRPALSQFEHGVNTPSDLPALSTVAAGYEILPGKLRAAVEFHHFDDKHADMAEHKEKALKRGTIEYMGGVEWDINKTFTVSAGAQRTDYGLSDDYQSHTSFSCDSYSIGFGGAVNLTKKLRLNVSYFWTTYEDYTKTVPAANPGGYCNTTLAGTDVYSRTNKVFGVGIDYKF